MTKTKEDSCNRDGQPRYPVESGEGRHPLVSIIVPTLNSEDTICKCLGSLERQTYTDIEITVVDGFSDDSTVEVARRHRCNVVITEGRGMAKQTSIGFRLARGTYLYRHDSDVVLDSGAIAEAVDLCENQGYDGVSVIWLPDPSISFWAKVRRLEWECKIQDKSRIGARFVRREVVEELGGLNEEMVAGEDYDLYNRLSSARKKMGVIQSTGLHLGEPKSLGEIVRKQFRYGQTLRPFLAEYRRSGMVQMGPVRKEILKNWRRFAKEPILAGGFLIYEIAIYGAAMGGYMASFLSRRDQRREG